MVGLGGDTGVVGERPGDGQPEAPATPCTELVLPELARTSRHRQEDIFFPPGVGIYLGA